MMLPSIALPDDYRPIRDLLTDRVILVTGAGQGLGRVAAMAFARHGATVILHGRNVGPPPPSQKCFATNRRKGWLKCAFRHLVLLVQNA